MAEPIAALAASRDSNSVTAFHQPQHLRTLLPTTQRSENASRLP
jgi:hypothetical protein